MFGAGCLLDATLSSPWCAAGGTADNCQHRAWHRQDALPLLSAFSWSAVLSLGQKTILVHGADATWRRKHRRAERRGLLIDKRSRQVLRRARPERICKFDGPKAGS